ncbi:MAG TPA: hypothetical protein VKU01_19165 [Bryobacteraceae bacterium]|nr:hypothetical protein [Bryobacteraceae bacterium]
MTSPQVFWPYFMLAATGLAALLRSWREVRTRRGLERVHWLAAVSIAVPMAVFGAEHLSSANAIMNGVPSWMPGRLFWTYLVGVALIAASLSIIFKVWDRLSASLLALMLFLFVAMIHVPNALASPNNRILWTIVARDLSFGAGSALLALTTATESRRSNTAGIAMAFVYAIAAVCVFFGVEHFLHPECVPGVPLAKLMPDWYPLARVWTYLIGAAMVAGGLAMFWNKTCRLAATAIGTLVLLAVFLIYLPIMISKPDIEGVNYFADTLLFAGVVLIASGASGAGKHSSPEKALSHGAG